MPCLKILTNIPKYRLPRDFGIRIIPLLSRLLKKPTHSFIVAVACNCALSSSENRTKPSAMATLETIGNLGLEENKIITKAVSAYVEKELGIQQKHFYITFYDIKAKNTALGGKTFD